MKPTSSPEAVGLIVPPSNPTLEDEIASLIDHSPRIHIARLPYSSASDLAVRNEIYLESYLDAARRFGTLPLRGIIIGCTGSNYRLGADEDQRRCEAASAELGLPFMTASLAVLQMIRSLGFRKIQLELPYPDWLIAQAVAYWQSAGFEVVVQHSILKKIGAQGAYSVNDQELEEYLLHVQPGPDTVVLLSGTGMHTLSAMADLITSYPAPLISSNLCIAQWLLGRSNLARETDLYRQLYAKLKSFSMVPEQAAADNLFNPYGSPQ